MTPLPAIQGGTTKPARDPSPIHERSATWQWPKLRANDTYKVIRKVRDAQAENTYGFAYYSELAQNELVYI